MTTKEDYIESNFFSVDQFAHIRNGGSKSLGRSHSVAKPGKRALTGTTVSFKDIEAINAQLTKLVEQQTNRLSEVVSTNAKFLSIIAHDLRGPFNLILGFLEVIKEELDNNDICDIKKNLNIVTDSANATLKLLDNLLLWAVSQNRAFSFNPVKINVNQLLKAEIESVRNSATIKKIRLSHSISPCLNVSADLQMVKTIFRNLISNAIKFSNTGGRINISATETEQFVEITVEDNGIGISAETQSNFLKTNELHSIDGTNGEPGVGFGLSISKEFVRMHGGKFKVESELGIGSKFTFSLPHYI